jgi:type VI secretion system protein ImpE
MAQSIATEAALKAGDLSAALAEIKNSIRKDPSNQDFRLLMFQILAVRGDWSSAKNQIDALMELSNKESEISLVYQAVLSAELQREQVFLGNTAPTVMGEPPDWMPFQLQLLRHAMRNEWSAALKCQEKVEELNVLPVATLDGLSLDWIQDADSRFGPIVEAIIKDTYYWIPQSRLRKLSISPPETLRDLVWARGEATFENGGVMPLFIPVRYPLAGSTTDGEKLARATRWSEPSENILIGAGQRQWMTSQGEDAGLLSTRTLGFEIEAFQTTDAGAVSPSDPV